MNWGYKILFVYILFVVGIMVLVFKSSTQKVELVTENYYEQELKFQQKIDQAERAQSLSSALKYEVKENLLTIYFPEEMKEVKINAHVHIYYAADEKKDKKLDLTSKNGKLEIQLPAGNKGGMPELKIDWVADGISYYAEHKLFVK